MSAPAFPSPQVIEPVQSVWGAPLQPCGCPSCKQVFLAASLRIGQLCPACAAARLEAQPVLGRSEPPEKIIPFAFSRENLAQPLRRFAGVWLSPADLDARRLLERAVPLYWPAWLVDCDLAGSWEGEAGYPYQVQSSRESYGSGGWNSQAVTETRTRWEPRTGQIQRHYDNLATPALSDHARLARLAGGYPFEQAQPFRPELLGSADVQLPDLAPQEAWQKAKGLVDQAAGRDCQQALDTRDVRRFALEASYSALNWTQLLMPVYASWYLDEGGKPHPVYINGVSGQVGGARLASPRKGWQAAGISAAVAVLLFLLSLLLFELPPPGSSIITMAQVLTLLAFGAGAFALVPPIWVWQWNHKERENNG